MYDVKNKSHNLLQYNKLTLNKTLSMFEWGNLPESIPHRELERLLQMHGYAYITEVEGELYALTGGLGGEQDVYGNPTTITISNPALSLFKTLNIKEDGVLIRNDDMQQGLWHIFDRFNSALVENDISVNMAVINSRMQTLITASDDRTKASADEYLKKVQDGELAVIGEHALFDGINTHTIGPGTGNGITNLIEYHQYIKASLHNELGLNSNFNMKRERLNTAEVGAVEDTLYPLIDNMMKSRLKGVEAINEMYDTEINVDYGSIWSAKNKELVDDEIDEQEPVSESAQETLDDDPMDTIDEDVETTGDDPEPSGDDSIDESDDTQDEPVEESTEDEDIDQTIEEEENNAYIDFTDNVTFDYIDPEEEDKE